MRYFQFYEALQLQQGTRTRRYETKLGERLRTLGAPAPLHNAIGVGGQWIAAANGNGKHAGSPQSTTTVATPTRSWRESLTSDPATFVLIGIPEDIGVKANGGVGGAATAWPDFINAFLNIQSTDMFSGDEVLLLGAFDFNEVAGTIQANAKNSREGLEAYRHAVANVIDEDVEELVKIVTAAGKVPIVIGGGHNNAYPLLKGAAKGWKQAGKLEAPRLNAINLDAHADFRIEEGRHSGNPFRYAMNEGFLDRYAIVGLHENYNSQSMMDDLYQNTQIQYTTYEDIFLKDILSFDQAVQLAVSFAKGSMAGVELDLDAIDWALTSAQTPCGISPLLARRYLWQAATGLKPAYLHIAEGASQTEDGRSSTLTGKLIAYLVSDFIKSQSGAQTN
jgi:formiminoglutamase